MGKKIHFRTFFRHTYISLWVPFIIHKAQKQITRKKIVYLFLPSMQKQHTHTTRSNHHVLFPLSFIIIIIILSLSSSLRHLLPPTNRTKAISNKVKTKTITRKKKDREKG